MTNVESSYVLRLSTVRMETVAVDLFSEFLINENLEEAEVVGMWVVIIVVIG